MDAEKTPVAILHELMSKIKTTPHYELSDNGLNSVPPIFTFKVTCNGIIACGSGRSKRDAKQNAASAMLEKMNRSTVVPIPSSSDKPVQSLSENIYVDNVIQDLQRLCINYKLVDPIYKDLEPTGPLHARLFNVQCIVSTLEATGVGRSKKQAKHEASYNMMEKIKSVYGVKNSFPLTDANKKMNKFDRITKNDDISTQAPDANRNSMLEKLKIQYDLKSGSKPRELMGNFEVLAQLVPRKLNDLTKVIEDCQRNINEDNINKVKQEFQTLLESANIDFHHMLLQTSEPDTYMLIVQLNTSPDILEMSLGTSKEQAELRTINKVIQALRKFVE